MGKLQDGDPKEFGLKMEHVTMVGDASRSSKEGGDVLMHGYHGCMAAACQNGRHKTVPSRSSS